MVKTIEVLPEGTKQIVGLLKQLKKNWDDHNSPAIKARVLRALEIILTDIEGHKLPFPKVTPIPGGGVTLSWESYHRDAEVEILPTGKLEFTFTLKKRDFEGEVTETVTTSGNLTSPEGIDMVLVWFSDSLSAQS